MSTPMAYIDIVVADDDQNIRALVTEILEEAGYAVCAVGDGLSALTAIREGHPAVALLDITMPVMTGDAALQQLRAEGISLPVVIMTAGTQPERFLQLGATAVLAKPFDLTRLLTVLTSVRAPPASLQVAYGLASGVLRGRAPAMTGLARREAA